MNIQFSIKIEALRIRVPIMYIKLKALRIATLIQDTYGCLFCIYKLEALTRHIWTKVQRQAKTSLPGCHWLFGMSQLCIKFLQLVQWIMQTVSGLIYESSYYCDL